MKQRPQDLSARGKRRKGVKLEWRMTEWTMNGEGGWKVQPVILVEGRVPFYADNPIAYIEKLQELHDDPALLPGTFYTLIGQLKDGYEQAWNVGGKDEKGSS